MMRKKVKLAFITNDSSRKATFKKRKKGLIKKVNELSTLCGINACAIIYSPYDSNPEVWPSNEGVRSVVSEFRSLPEMDQQKKMVDQDAFTRQRITKSSDLLRRLKKDSRELEMTQIMFHSLMGHMRNYNMNILDLNDLGYMIDHYIKDLIRRIEILHNSGVEIGESSNDGGASEGIASTMVMASTITTTHEVGASSSAAFYRPIQQQQHFYHPSAPHVGLFEPPRNLNMSMNHNHNQQPWFMNMTNHPQQLSNTAEQIGFPFMEHNHQQHQQHQPQPHQQTTSDSTTVVALSPSNVNPVTNPNLTNNIWFH